MGKCSLFDRPESLGMQSVEKGESSKRKSPRLYKVRPVRNHWQKWLPFVCFVCVFPAHSSLFSQSSWKLLPLVLHMLIEH